jgi:hypothetical protein
LVDQFIDLSSVMGSMAENALFAMIPFGLLLFALYKVALNKE